MVLRPRSGRTSAKATHGPKRTEGSGDRAAYGVLAGAVRIVRWHTYAADAVDAGHLPPDGRT